MAQVAGPGKFARRVDGTAFDKNATRQPIREMPSQAYGEGVQMQALQASAPMSATPSMPSAMRPTPLSAPTERPNEPVTAGAPFGGYKQSGIGRENHKMMLDHYRQSKNMLISYNKNKLGFF